MTHEVAVVGVPPAESVAWGPSGRGYVHAREVEAPGNCVDLDGERARRFADAFDLPERRVFGDHRPRPGDRRDAAGTHADIVVDCAEAGVAAVHCEKPMADRWGDCERMDEECRRADVQLIFNHQRHTTTLSEGPTRPSSRAESGRSAAWSSPDPTSSRRASTSSTSVTGSRAIQTRSGC